MMSFRLETGLTKHAFLLVLWLDKIFIAIFVDKVLGRYLLVWLFGLVIVCYGISRDCLLGHVIFFVVIFYGYKLQSMDCTCMSTFFPFLFGLHSFEWLMVQSMDPHALLPSLLRGLLGLPLFLTSAFYFHSSNKPFYLIPRVDRRGKREN